MVIIKIKKLPQLLLPKNLLLLLKKLQQPPKKLLKNMKQNVDYFLLVMEML